MDQRETHFPSSHIYGDEGEFGRGCKETGKSKVKEGKKSVLGGVPNSIPAKVFIRLQEKPNSGIRMDNREQVWDKVEEEQQELMEAVRSGDQSHIEEEFGDLMFSMINYARFLSIDAETALERTNRKFINRFEKMEEAVGLSGKQMNDLSLAELDAIWNEVKKQKTTD
jgi:XTP/dITP diphosphohydrolase